MLYRHCFCFVHFLRKAFTWRWLLGASFMSVDVILLHVGFGFGGRYTIVGLLNQTWSDSARSHLSQYKFEPHWFLLGCNNLTRHPGSVQVLNSYIFINIPFLHCTVTVTHACCIVHPEPPYADDRKMTFSLRQICSDKTHYWVNCPRRCSTIMAAIPSGRPLYK